MAVSKRLRYEILRRDNHACRYCGASAPDAPLTVDQQEVARTVVESWATEERPGGGHTNG